MNQYIRHVVSEMDDSMIQRCIICGEVICDYTNAMWSSGQDAPKGFGEGNLYISKTGNPTVFRTDHWEPPTEFDNCKP